MLLKGSDTVTIQNFLRQRWVQAAIPVTLIILGIALPFFFFNRYTDQVNAIFALFVDLRQLDLIILTLIWMLWLACQVIQINASYHLVGIHSRPNQLILLTVANHFVNLFMPSGNVSTFALFAWHGSRQGWQASRTPFALILFSLVQYSTLGIMLIFTFLLLPQNTPFYVIGLSTAATVILATLVSWLFFIALIFKSGWFEWGWSLVEMLPFQIAARIQRQSIVQYGINAYHNVQADIKAGSISHWIQLVGFGLAARLFNYLLIWTCGRAFGAMLNWEGVVSAGGIGVLFTIVSPIPRGVGIAEGGIAIALTQFGIELSQATAIGLLARGFTLWLTVIVGGLCFLRLGVRDLTTKWSADVPDPDSEPEDHP